MPINSSILGLPIPTGKTVLMQHLQTLVLRGNHWWIGGLISADKFERLAYKMVERYPLLRSERGRSYDRAKGLASVHFVAFPTDIGIVWWVLSSDGKRGLADVTSPDAHVARHAMAADGHITFEDYVLLYAHKKDARTIHDVKTGMEKKILKNCSTWTWKITQNAYKEVRAAMASEVAALNYGDDSNPANLYGVRGLLAFQRRRPLFSGVRSQVLQLHREANLLWSGVRKTWLARHPKLAAQNAVAAGELRPLTDITSKFLPKMGRFKVFGTRNLRSMLNEDTR